MNKTCETCPTVMTNVKASRRFCPACVHQRYLDYQRRHSAEVRNAKPPKTCVDCGAPTGSPWSPRCPTHRASVRSAARAEWRAANPEKALAGRESAEKARARWLKQYGLTLEDYARMLERQGGVCKLCGGTNASKANLYVDHCHETNTVRGLLCVKCNAALGTLGDNEAGLLKALAYVRGEHAQY